MALTLVTGTGGAGKTSNTLWKYYNLLKEQPKYKHTDSKTGEVSEVDRKIYTFNVAGIDYEKTGFLPCEDPTKWMELPPGSTLIIDETPNLDDMGFADFASNKKTAGELSSHIKELRTHRHYGVDIVFITQHPSLINKGIRILINEHWHYHRPFNIKHTTLYRNSKVMDPEDKKTLGKANGTTKSIVKLPKDVFSMYKSTELDTMNGKLPKWIFILPIIGVLFVIFCIYMLLSALGIISDEEEEVSESSNSEVSEKSKISTNKKTSNSDEKIINYFSKDKEVLATEEEISKMFKPRTIGRPETAPVYDELYTLNVKSYPRLAGCIFIESRDRCVCHTQQGTPYQATKSFCKNYLNGYIPFNHTIPDYVLGQDLKNDSEGNNNNTGRNEGKGKEGVSE